MGERLLLVGLVLLALLGVGIVVWYAGAFLGEGRPVMARGMW